MPIPAELQEFIERKGDYYFFAAQSKLPAFKKRKLASLEKVLTENHELLEEWQKRQVFTSDPTELRKAAAEINRLKVLEAEFEKEYNNLLDS